MATSLDTALFVVDQLAGIGNVSYRKMFGEYMVYLNGKPIFLLCDDTLFVKINPTTTALLDEDAEQAYPYEGATLRYVVDFPDDRERLQELALALEPITPLPKRKK